MVFTNAQITAFFEDGDQMGLSNRTRVYLQGEGIIDPGDLLEFVERRPGRKSLRRARGRLRLQGRETLRTLP